MSKEITNGSRHKLRFLIEKYSSKSEIKKPSESRKTTSLNTIVKYGKLILIEFGIDITEINIKEEGISIENFTNLVERLYDLGYKDGLIKYGHGKDLVREQEMKGISLTKHKKTGFIMSNMEK